MSLSSRMLRSVTPRAARRLSSTPPPPPASTRPDAETVQGLAESARLQEKMWNTFVPERSVRFGDQRFWILVGIVGGLHLFNNYRDAQKLPESDLPDGVARRLPDGRLLMVDGSISAPGADDSAHTHTLHKVKTAEEQAPGVINSLVRRAKDAV